MRQFVVRGMDQLQAVAKIILGLSPDKPWRIELTPHRSKRTPDQNALLWAIYTEIAKGTGHSSEEIHEALKHKLLPPRHITVADQVLMVPGSTAKLDTAAFSDYVEQVRAWSASELGIVV